MNNMEKLTFPANYFEGEIRHGFFVSENRKKLWATELELLRNLARICEKHAIRWFLDGGSLLGAVRHAGFIPWDDDIDVVMFREDYDEFIKVCLSELPEPLFLQTNETDQSIYCHAKLRKTDTTCILRGDAEAHFPFNQGIFIDIFPLDNVPEDAKEQDRFMYQLSLIQIELKMLMNRWWKFSRDDYHERGRIAYLKQEYETLRKTYKYDRTSVVATLAFPRNKNSVKRKDHYEMVEYLPFENMMCPVPGVYQEVLRLIYGDNFMTPVMGASQHGELLVNFSESYKNNPKTYDKL